MASPLLILQDSDVRESCLGIWGLSSKNCWWRSIIYLLVCFCKDDIFSTFHFGITPTRLWNVNPLILYKVMPINKLERIQWPLLKLLKSLLNAMRTCNFPIPVISHTTNKLPTRIACPCYFANLYSDWSTTWMPWHAMYLAWKSQQFPIRVLGHFLSIRHLILQYLLYFVVCLWNCLLCVGLTIHL